MGVVSLTVSSLLWLSPLTNCSTTRAHSWTCMDLYIFATPYRVTWDYYFLGRDHTLEIKEWEGKAEYEYVKNKGVSIFLMESGMIGTLQALWDVFPLFSNTGWGESSNLAFLKKHMGANFDERPQPWVTNITIEDVHSGDFLAISKIRGRWGGFETLEKWVTGAYAGHTAVLLKDNEGKLYVGESGHENEEGQDDIAVMPWEEWWEFELTKDDANPHIALLPLRADMLKFLFSVVQVASVMTVWNHIQPDYAANMWNEALNKRLGTESIYFILHSFLDLSVNFDSTGLFHDLSSLCMGKAIKDNPRVNSSQPYIKGLVSPQ
ncbi:hypothetical protein ACHQM5_010818 [Ranunculus cassubicifolius]